MYQALPTIEIIQTEFACRLQLQYSRQRYESDGFFFNDLATMIVIYLNSKSISRHIAKS